MKSEVRSSHTCTVRSALGSPKVNGGADEVVLHVEPVIDECLSVSRFDTPPVPKPSASDIGKKKLLSCGQRKLG